MGILPRRGAPAPLAPSRHPEAPQRRARSLVRNAWILAAHLGGASLACTPESDTPRTPPGPNASELVTVAELVTPPPATNPAGTSRNGRIEAAAEPVTGLCPEAQHAAAGEFCVSFWNGLRAGEARSLPHEERCRLAATLVRAAIETVDRTDWSRIDDEAPAAVVLVGPDRRSTRALLIARDESCPPVQVPRTTGETIDVGVLGQALRPTRPTIALHIDARRPEDCPCSASFSWRLGDTVGEMSPPRRLPDGGTRTYVAPITSLGPLQPRLVVEVEIDGAGEFVVTSRAIEID